jgi:hypothetical protein
MATLQEIQTYVTGMPTLKQRFTAGRVQAAWDILAEAGGGTTPARVAWRLKIFNNQMQIWIESTFGFCLTPAYSLLAMASPTRRS